MVTPKRVGHLAVQGGRLCLHTDTAIQLTSRLLERHQNPWWPLWYHWRPVGWTALRCLATSHIYLLWQIEVKSTNPWFQGSHHYLVWGQWTYAKPWFQGSHHYLVWGQWIFAVSSLPERAEMSRGCLFPDSIPNRDVKHRLLIKLTREGSYKIGGFHCLLPKDRITWDNQYIVHICYIHIQTVVKEVNKGIRCANL